jgi:hypothetical protein
MATYHCRVAATTTATTVLRYLDALGTVAADHTIIVDGEYRLVLTDREIVALKSHGLEVLLGERLATRGERDDVGVPDGSSVDLLSGFVTGYLDGVQVANRVTAIAAAFPTWCSVVMPPFATSGYDGSLPGATGPATVRALRITANAAVRSRPGFLVVGGTHAREWMNPLIALEFAEQLLHNVDPASTDPQIIAITRIVTQGDVIIVPVMNPDGLTFSIHDDAGWRKNRRPNAGAPTCPGVDDNRNYEVYFGGAGSSSTPCDEAYRGSSAFSEAETRNIQWLLEEFPNVLVGVDLHSFGQQILRPGPGGGTFISSLPVSPEDDAIYTGLETTLRTAIASVNGASYSVGSTSNHAGTSDEYMFFAHRVFGFNTECGTSFQPAWADAVPIIGEVVTGLRALALATLDLTLTTPTPLHVVQCIDRTGSMVTFGYESAARANAKRFIDLLSLGDTTGVVTFADPAADPLATPPGDRAQTAFALTLLDDPGDAAAARSAIDAIAFGGWTPIGAGLARSASMLASSGSPRAILLISDGYENRDPSVATVLSTWPANLRVFTIALGSAADTALLQQIATQTGGVFQASPTALDLHLIYNQMRADITDDGLVVNRAIDAEQDEDEQSAHVEPGADWLTVTVSTMDRQSPETAVVSPYGRRVAPDDFGVRVAQGEGYAIFRIARPAPGRWRIRTDKRRSACVVAAFVTSPLRTRIRLRPDLGHEAGLVGDVRVSLGRARLEFVRSRFRLRTLPDVALPREQPCGATPGWTDSMPRDALASIGATMRSRTLTIERGGRIPAPPGLARVEIDIEGQLPGGALFRRVALRTVRVSRDRHHADEHARRDHG